ncbi:MAG: TolB family protein [Flavobacteriaceae bacterium]
MPTKPIIYFLLALLYSNCALSQIKLVKEFCLTQNKFNNRYASYSPDGNKIIFESDRDGNWEIYLMDADGTNQKRLTANEDADRRPSWHPNGKMILFESDKSGRPELYTFNLEDKSIDKIPSLDLEGEPMFASFSPDENFIAIGLKETDDRSNIFLLNEQGKIIKQLTNSDKRSTYPKWSKNGKEIVYFSRKETNNQDDEIYKLNVENGQEVRLTNWPKHNFCPSWSNDGKKIAYVTSMEGTRPEIYIMDADGENKTRITKNEDGDTLPNWSPKKNALLITGFRNGSYQICKLVLSE